MQQGREIRVRVQKPGEGVVRQFSKPKELSKDYSPLSPIRDVDALFAENKENKADLKEEDLVDELCQTRMSDGHVSLLARVLDLEAKEAERAREFGITTQLIRGIQKRMELMQGSICDQFEQLDSYCGSMSADILAELKLEIDRAFANKQIDDVRAEMVQSSKRLEALETHVRESPIGTQVSDVTIPASMPRPVSVTEFQAAITRLHDRVENLENSVEANVKSLDQIAEPVDEVRVRLEELRLECMASSAKAVQDLQARMDVFTSRLDACLPIAKSHQPASHQPVSHQPALLQPASHQPVLDAKEATAPKPIYDGCPKSRSLSPRISHVTKTTTSYITSTPQRQTSRIALTPSTASVSVATRRSICVRPPSDATTGSREPREASVGPKPREASIGPKRATASARTRTDSPTPMTPINYSVPREPSAPQELAPLPVQTLDAASASDSPIGRGSGSLGVFASRGSSPRVEQQSLNASASRSKSGPSTAVNRQASLTGTTHVVGQAHTRRSSPQMRYGHSVVAQPVVSTQGLSSERNYKVMSTLTARTAEPTPRSPGEVIKSFWASYHNAGGS